MDLLGEVNVVAQAIGRLGVGLVQSKSKWCNVQGLVELDLFDLTRVNSFELV